MFEYLYQPKQKKEEFVQEYAYVEDYSLYHREVPEKKEKKDEDPRGVVEIDLNNGNAIEIT